MAPDPFQIAGMRFTSKPKHLLIEGKGITIEAAERPRGKGLLITATSHRGDRLHEVEAVTATLRLLNRLGGLEAVRSSRREEHMRTALILSRTAQMLGEALAGRARFEVREEAREALAQARARCEELDALLWPGGHVEAADAG